MNELTKFKRLALFDGSEFSAEKKHDAAQVPEIIMLVRFGNNLFTKGGGRGEFLFSEKDADTVIAEFRSRNRDIVIDYEHQTLKGDKAPAAGWISDIKKTREGLSAKVKYWTEEAAKHIKRGEYRYISPVVQFSRRSKTVCALHSVALTNHPALHGIPALAADDTHADDVSFRNKKITKGQKMDEILSLLNLLPLADSSAEEKFREISVAINGLLKIRDSLNDFLERHGTASLEEFTAQVEREKEQLHSEIKRKESGEAVRKAFSDGKITEAQRIWAGKFAQKDIEAFREWSKTAPVIVPDNQGTEQLPEKRSGENNEFQNTIFRNLGLTEKDIKDN